jgi:hypothetical protein
LKQCEVCFLKARRKAGQAWRLEAGDTFLPVAQCKAEGIGLRTSTTTLLVAILVTIHQCAQGLRRSISSLLISNRAAGLLAALTA